MKPLHLIHNPKAGEGKHDGEELQELLSENGYRCRYYSTKEASWKDLQTKIGTLVIAGGDGTVRKVARKILDDQIEAEKLAIIPLGTANNIARVLNIGGNIREIIRSWDKARFKHYDVGLINSSAGRSFFLESFGFGVFCRLMKEMEKIESALDSPRASIHAALTMLQHLIISYPSVQCDIEVDGKNHSGRFLLGEVMNSPCLGPNLCLSPLSDPGDGLLELVLIGEEDRARFAAFVEGSCRGAEILSSFETLKGREIKMFWHGGDAHADDQILDWKKPCEVLLQLNKGLLNFMVP